MLHMVAGFEAALGFGFILNIRGLFVHFGIRKSSGNRINKKISVEAFRNMLAGHISATQRLDDTAPKKCRSGGEPLTILSLI